MNKDQNYWKENISLIIRCLTIWFMSSYVFSIILVDQLNTIRFAQQGSIYVFVILIFYYAYKIGDIDNKYGTDGS